MVRPDDEVVVAIAVHVARARDAEAEVVLCRAVRGDDLVLGRQQRIDHHRPLDSCGVHAHDEVAALGLHPRRHPGARRIPGEQRVVAPSAAHAPGQAGALPVVVHRQQLPLGEAYSDGNRPGARRFVEGPAVLQPVGPARPPLGHRAVVQLDLAHAGGAEGLCSGRAVPFARLGAADLAVPIGHGRQPDGIVVCGREQPGGGQLGAEPAADARCEHAGFHGLKLPTVSGDQGQDLILRFEGERRGPGVGALPGDVFEAGALCRGAAREEEGQQVARRGHAWSWGSESRTRQGEPSQCPRQGVA